VFGLGFTEVLIILGVVLLVVGPDKMPELARTLGKGMFQLRKAADEFREEVQLSKLDMPRNPIGEEIAEIRSLVAVGVADDCPEAEPQALAKEDTADRIEQDPSNLEDEN